MTLGEVVEAFYEVNGNESFSRYGNNTEAGSEAVSRHRIPSSFCVDPDNEKLLVCPRANLDKGSTVYKCCPFGKQLKLPLFSGNHDFEYAASKHLTDMQQMQNKNKLEGPVFLVYY